VPFAIDASVIEADASCNRRVDGKLTAPSEDELATRPVREYLEVLDRAATEEAKCVDDGDTSPPGNPPSEPKYTSLTDPAAAWTNNGQMKSLFAYATNYLIDTDHAVIVDVEAIPARWSAEVAATKTMLERARRSRIDAPHAGSGRGLWLRPHARLADGARRRTAYPNSRSRASDEGLF
jgi:hypothetical protein